MRHATLEDRVREIIAEQLIVDQAELQPEKELADDLGADSLDKIELVMAIEEEFYIAISDAETEQIETVGELFKFLRARGVEVHA